MTSYEWCEEAFVTTCIVALMTFLCLFYAVGAIVAAAIILPFAILGAPVALVIAWRSKRG